MTGLFITFEGGEGCGKSTQIASLKARLEAMDKTVVQTREPGGTALGEYVRSLLQHHDAGQGMSPEAELLLFAASRAQHVRELIEPAIAQGQIVLCDRFLDSPQFTKESLAPSIPRKWRRLINSPLAIASPI